MKPDQEDQEDHEEITKHIVGGEEVYLAWITFQLERTACAKILWQEGAWCTHKTNMEYWKWGEAWPAWREKQTLGNMKNVVLPLPQNGKGVDIQKLLQQLGYEKMFSWKAQISFPVD